jgi:hypothetical protein
MFSTISNFSIFPKKVIGPDASENVLGRPGGSGELLGASGGGPGGVREASWGVLGHSGRLRGASWEGLGRSWGDLGATLEAVRFRIVFLSILSAKRVPKGRHFGSQNGAKIDPKIIQNRSRFSRAKKYPSRSSWDRLGAVLGRSWAILTGLRAILGQSWAGWGSQNH